MLRLRNAKGEIITVPKLKFIEILDADQNVALVVFPDNGGISIIRGSDPEARPYSRITGCKFSHLVTLPSDLLS